MTRKHFEAIARILAKHNIVDPAAGFDEGYSAASGSITVEMADFLATQNPNFDRARFLTASGF